MNEEGTYRVMHVLTRLLLREGIESLVQRQHVSVGLLDLAGIRPIVIVGAIGYSHESIVVYRLLFPPKWTLAQLENV